MNQEKRAKAIKITVIVLAVLLALCLIALGVRYFWLRNGSQTATSTVTENIVGDVNTATGGQLESAPEAADGSSPGAQSGTGNIAAPATETEKTGLQLYRGAETDNTPFSVIGMLPGDTVEKLFMIDVYHKDPVTVNFRTSVTQETQSVGEILAVRVTDGQGTVLYDGSFSALRDGIDLSLPAAESGLDTLRYSVSVSLPTSADNTYAGASLTADLIWSVPDGELTNPYTGDPVNIALMTGAAAAAAGLIVLLAVSRKKGGVHNG